MLKFASWAYDGNKLDLDLYEGMKEMDVSEYRSMTEWTVKNVPAVYTRVHYPCCEEPYPRLTFYLEIQREPSFFIVKCIIPPAHLSFVWLHLHSPS